MNLIGIVSLLKPVVACMLLSETKVASAFANDNTPSGWKNRPAYPEIEEQLASQKLSMGGDAVDQSQQQKERQPWEFGRFLQQSSKFINVPILSGGPREPRVIQPGDTLWDASRDNAFSFGPLDDVVMGGVSSSTFDNQSGLWKGTVTDANNGGFIGIRSYPPVTWDLSACRGIKIKVAIPSQDSAERRYKIILRDSTDFNGVCWSTSINVGSQWWQRNSLLSNFLPGDDDTGTILNTVTVDFDKQIPTIFAKTVPNQTFDASNVVGFQLAYSKFEYDGELNPYFELGGVNLRILEITAY